MERLMQVLKPPPARHRAPRKPRTPAERPANVFGDQGYEADALAIDHLLGYDPRDRFL